YYPTLDSRKLAKGKISASELLFDCPRWHLCLDTETIHSNRWSSVPGAKWISYSRPSDTLRTRTGIQPVRDQRPTSIRFMLYAPELRRVADIIRVGEEFRRAVMGCFGIW